VKVPTGAFVARRNGKVFVTGNSQGFPKSLNVFKQILKLVEKNLQGKAKGKILWAHEAPDADLTEDPEVLTVTLFEKPFQVRRHTIEDQSLFELPPELLRLKGYGTALKPSWEPILVFRKPVEGTISQTAAVFGAGAMNIDGGRVKHASAADFASHKAMVDALKAKGGSLGGSWKNSSDLSGANDVSNAGRWPANIVLVHASGCRQVGTERIDAPVINRFDDGMKPFGNGAGHAFTSVKTGDADGKEVVPIYECVDGCPIKILDGQSAPDSAKNKGAARFFTQAMPEAPFFYAGKATRREKNAGVEPLKLTGKQLSLKESLSEEALEELALLWDDLDTEREVIPESEVLGRIPSEMIKRFFEYVKEVRNFHPCLHPDALVLTEGGYRPIHQIEVGRKVYAADGTFRRVYDVSRHPYTSTDLFEIRVLGVQTTTLASDNHPFLIWRPVRVRGAVRGGAVMWLQADEIEVGDYTMSPVLSPGLGNKELPESRDFWFLFGLYLAEGVIQQAGHGENGYPSFSLHEDETPLIDRIRAYFGEDKVKVYPKGDSKGVQVMAFDAKAGSLFKLLGGTGSGAKALASICWTLSRECQTAIFEGWSAGDGGQVREHLQAKTISPDLATHMQLLGEGAGHRTRVYRSEAVEGKGIGGRKFKTTQPMFQLDFSGGATQPAWVDHEGTKYRIRYVKEVKHVPYVGDVVNLSVEGDPTFQTSVGMSHNTVKPVKLMQWLVRVMTPKDGVVLDPYCGSGTTCLAAISEKTKFIGIERDEAYKRIADMRIAFHQETKGGEIRQAENFDLFQSMDDGDPFGG